METKEVFRIGSPMGTSSFFPPVTPSTPVGASLADRAFGWSSSLDLSKMDLSKELRIWPGDSSPLGATWDGAGVNFAIFTEHATKVELCLFLDPGDNKEAVRIDMPEYTDHVYHCYLPDIRPGQLYGYRVHGPWEPENGHRFNSNKVLLDPYSKAIGRHLMWDDSMFAYKIGDDDTTFSEDDNAAFCTLSTVIDTAFSWANDKIPNTPWHRTIIYETHVRSLTIDHPDIPTHLRGTYAAVCFQPIIDHFKSLGITAVEFMPVQYCIDQRGLLEKGLVDYWGYNTIGFFAPDPRFSSKPHDPLVAVQEFKTMVRVLHHHGIEVIMDVVYNHTAEGNHMGPTLSFKGIDNTSYYKKNPDNYRYYYDYTGCGNTLNVSHPRVLQLIMDSLRYWITEMHVDGFRFDLASALARTFFDVDRLSAFFDIIHQDPIISQVKLIAEPWDLGDGGYQVGNFPVLWTEWNGKYRDSIRGYWAGKGVTLSEVATRVTGSYDLYAHGGRDPSASINFVTAHDGFTLSDLVSYNEKHNMANLEGNKDGHEANCSWNCGAEGPTDDPEINELRRRQRANLIATLLLSHGVPMICGGDELCKTQYGNNNAYCQDKLNWYKWGIESEEKEEFLEFVQKLCVIRRKQAVLQRRKFSTDNISWYSPSGRAPTEEEWHKPDFQCFGYMMDGRQITEKGRQGQVIMGDTFLILMNAQFHDVDFMLPYHRSGQPWRLSLTTMAKMKPDTVWGLGEKFPLQHHSLAVFILFTAKKYWTKRL